jgi:hypothetical protein
VCPAGLLRRSQARREDLATDELDRVHERIGHKQSRRPGGAGDGAPATVPAVAGLDLGHPAVKDAYMTSETNSAAKSGQESVVLASFDSYRRAEHMLASLGRGFRRKARKGGTTAVVARGNPDGSLKVTESQVLTASDFAATLIRLSLSWTVGFLGLIPTLKGAKSQAHAAHVRKGHVGSDDHQAHKILAEAGPHAAIALVRCEDGETRQMVAAAAADSARDSWDGSLTEFLADLDPGSAHDWVRAAVGESSSTNR